MDIKELEKEFTGLTQEAGERFMLDAMTNAAKSAQVEAIREIISSLPDPLERSRIKNEWSALMRKKLQAPHTRWPEPRQWTEEED